MLNDLLYRLRALFRRTNIETELDDELQFHLEKQIEKLTRLGLSRHEAVRRARMELGGVAQVKEEARASWGITLIDSLRQDLAYALRMLVKSPGFSLAVVMSLALGIGANTAISTLMDAIMWRALPIRDPEGLMVFGWQSERGIQTGLNYRVYRTLLENNEVLEVAGHAAAPVNISVDGSVEPTIQGHLVTGGYFALVGVPPLIGRAIGPEDDLAPNAHPVAMLTHGYWERRFARDASVIGRTIRVSGAPFTIIGVTSPEFFGVEPGVSPDLFLPMMMQPTVMPSFENLLEDPIVNRTWVQAIARLKPGVGRDQAASALSAWWTTEMSRREALRGTSQAKGKNLPAVEPVKVALQPVTAVSEMYRQFSQPLAILMAMVGLVLLLACANAANLLMARAAARRPEFAMRLALGAGRGRMLRQLLVESFLLSAIAGIAGILLARLATQLLVFYISTGRTPVMLNLNPNPRVLLFTIAISAVTGILFGLAPAWRAIRIDLTPALKNLGRSLSHRRLKPDRALVALQVALSLVLLFGAGLFARSFQNLNGHDTEQRENVLIARVEPRGSDQRGIPGTTERLDQIYRGLIEQVGRVPGVRLVSMAQVRPVAPTTSAGIGVRDQSGQTIRVPGLAVYPNYFATIGMSLAAGRDFDAADLRPDAPLVCIVNEAYVRRFFEDRNPLGQTCFSARRPLLSNSFSNPSSLPQPYQIVGVVKDSRFTNPTGEVEPVVYTTFFQLGSGRGQMVLHVRVSGNPEAVANRIRDEVAEVDPTLPMFEIRTLQQEMDAALVRQRLIAMLSTLFGVAALLLACVGLYGLLSFSMVQRTGEMGIRMALGARHAGIIWLVMREALALVIVGLAVGAIGAAALGRLAANQISGLLFRLEATDPLTMAAAAALLVLVAVLAAYLPARRASRLDPLAALRTE